MSWWHPKFPQLYKNSFLRWLPSVELTICELENHHAINGNINELNAYFQ
jgi:hypothetical protein